MPASLRQAALCDAHALQGMQPWSRDKERRVMAAWQAVESIMEADAAQEWRMIDAMIARLIELKGGRCG